MPSGQILYLMMFVGKCSCTSHVLQYSSSRSYEHSRSLQSSLCPEVVTVLNMFILCCSIALCLHKFEKRRQNYTYFHKPPNFFISFLHFQSISPKKELAIWLNFCIFAPESIKSSARKGDSPTEQNVATVVSTMRKQ